MQNKLDTKFCGKDVPASLRIIQYGFEHSEFSKEELKKEVEIDDSTFERYWLRVKMVEQLEEKKFCLSLQGTAIYLQLLSYQHAYKEASKAHKYSVTAIVIAILSLIAVIISLFCK